MSNTIDLERIIEIWQAENPPCQNFVTPSKTMSSTEIAAQISELIGLPITAAELFNTLVARGYRYKATSDGFVWLIQ